MLRTILISLHRESCRCRALTALHQRAGLQSTKLYLPSTTPLFRTYTSSKALADRIDKVSDVVPPPPPPPPSQSGLNAESSSSTDEFIAPAAVSSGVGDTMTTDGKLLYLESQHFTVRIMTAITGVNLTYWGSQVAMHNLFKGTVVQGVDLSGGDPFFSYLGLLATGLFVFFTRSYAHHAVYQCYESADQHRIGFQVHTILGFPGRKFEVAKGSARFVDAKNVTHLGSYFLPHSEGELMARKHAEHKQSGKTSLVKRLFFNSSNVTVAVDGLDGNLLLDAHGNYLDAEQLCKLLTPVGAMAGAEGIVEDKLWDEKEHRADWKKQQTQTRQRNKTRR